MTYTEKEASQKRCCGPTGTGHTSNGVRWCLGSQCMAWLKTGQVGIGPNGEKRDRDMDGRTRWTDIGRCGLAEKV